MKTGPLSPRFSSGRSNRATTVQSRRDRGNEFINGDGATPISIRATVDVAQILTSARDACATIWHGRPSSKFKGTSTAGRSSAYVSVTLCSLRVTITCATARSHRETMVNSQTKMMLTAVFMSDSRPRLIFARNNKMPSLLGGGDGDDTWLERHGGARRSGTGETR